MYIYKRQSKLRINKFLARPVHTVTGSSDNNDYVHIFGCIVSECVAEYRLPNSMMPPNNTFCKRIESLEQQNVVKKKLFSFLSFATHISTCSKFKFDYLLDPFGYAILPYVLYTFYTIFYLSIFYVYLWLKFLEEKKNSDFWANEHRA